MTDRTRRPAVTVYGADWCGDCRRSKRLLERLGVPFTYVDVDEDPAELAEVLRRNQGRQTIPVIVFEDGTHLTEPSDPQLAAKVAQMPVSR